MIQLQTINYLLDSKDTSFLLLNNLSDEYFSDYKAEYNFIKNHYEKYSFIPDKASFLDNFPDFTTIEVTESPKYLADKLIKDYNSRQLIHLVNSIAKAINNNDQDKAINIYNNSRDLLINGNSLECVDITQDTTRYDRYLEKCSNFDNYYVTTGFQELDDIFGGWDRKEELATIIARTNQGKSWLLLRSAVAAARKGLNVGIYSGEMSEDKVGYRIDTLASHISNMSMIHGNKEIEPKYKKYLDEIKSNIPGSIKVMTPSMISGPAGVNALRAFIEKEHLDMLCVDQHSLLEDDHNAKNPVERASNISKDLKNLQVLKQIPIITVSQQNRNSTENGVDASHIAQSDRIGQDSTIILGFEQKDGVLTMTLIKSRDSGAGKKLQYALHLDTGDFEYMPSSDDAANGHASTNSCEDLYNKYENPDEGEVF